VGGAPPAVGSGPYAGDVTAGGAGLGDGAGAEAGGGDGVEPGVGEDAGGGVGVGVGSGAASEATTVTVPCIERGCSSHKYAYEPGAANVQLPLQLAFCGELGSGGTVSEESNRTHEVGCASVKSTLCRLSPSG
jgi:hypothetical protein